MTEKDVEREREADRQLTLTRGEQIEGIGRFPEVKGLCRTCSQAVIRRQAYSELPTVLCEVIFNRPHQVPLDIMECSKYQRKGELSLWQMEEMATIIDSRVKGGQYL